MTREYRPPERALEAAEAARPRRAESRSDESATKRASNGEDRRAGDQRVPIDAAPKLFD